MHSSKAIEQIVPAGQTAPGPQAGPPSLMQLEPYGPGRAPAGQTPQWSPRVHWAPQHRPGSPLKSQKDWVPSQVGAKHAPPTQLVPVGQGASFGQLSKAPPSSTQAYSPIRLQTPPTGQVPPQEPQFSGSAPRSLHIGPQQAPSAPASVRQLPMFSNGGLSGAEFAPPSAQSSSGWQYPPAQ